MARLRTLAFAKCRLASVRLKNLPSRASWFFVGKFVGNIHCFTKNAMHFCQKQCMLCTPSIASSFPLALAPNPPHQPAPPFIQYLEPVFTAKCCRIAEAFSFRARRIFAANLGGLQENATQHGMKMTGETAARAVNAGSYLKR